MKFLKAIEKDIPQLKEIWTNTFNTPKNFVNDFFENRWPIDHCYIAKEKDKIFSVLHCLQFSFSREMNNTDVSYIVGATTLLEMQNQGLCSNLLTLAHQDEGKILTLYPQFNSYFERHGFYYSANNIGFKLNGNKKNKVINEKYDISTIYINSTEKTGSLDRDKFSWYSIQSNCKTIIAEDNFEKAYALIIDDIAYETMCEGINSARALKEKLETLNVSQIWMPSNSPLAYLFETQPIFIPLGMSSEKNICANLYIPEQL